LYSTFVQIERGGDVFPSESIIIDQKRRDLKRRILKLRPAQEYHMPGLRTWLSSTKQDVPASQPEDDKLWPPSAIPKSLRSTLCRDGLARTERELRETHALERLEDLRTHLRYRTELQRFKRYNLIGQIAHTKSYELQAKVQKKVRLATELYRASYNALLELAGPGTWQRQLQELTLNDVVGLTERLMREEEKQELQLTCQRANLSGGPLTVPLSTVNLGEGHRTLSWIWRGVTVGEMEKDEAGELHEGFRIEWAKSRARYLRWREEVLLVMEEMRRVIAYGEWKAQWWINCLQAPPLVLTPLTEGLNAYAREQYIFEVQFQEKLEDAWKDIQQRARRAITKQDRLRELDMTLGFQEDAGDDDMDLDDIERTIDEEEEEEEERHHAGTDREDNVEDDGSESDEDT
jgi:hypothetical protein